MTSSNEHNKIVVEATKWAYIITWSSMLFCVGLTVFSGLCCFYFIETDEMIFVLCFVVLLFGWLSYITYKPANKAVHKLILVGEFVDIPELKVISKFSDLNFRATNDADNYFGIAFEFKGVTRYISRFSRNFRELQVRVFNQESNLRYESSQDQLRIDREVLGRGGSTENELDLKSIPFTVERRFWSRVREIYDVVGVLAIALGCIWFSFKSYYDLNEVLALFSFAIGVFLLRSMFSNLKYVFPRIDKIHVRNGHVLIEPWGATIKFCDLNFRLEAYSYGGPLIYSLCHNSKKGFVRSSWNGFEDLQRYLRVYEDEPNKSLFDELEQERLALEQKLDDGLISEEEYFNTLDETIEGNDDLRKFKSNIEQDLAEFNRISNIKRHYGTDASIYILFMVAMVFLRPYMEQDPLENKFAHFMERTYLNALFGDSNDSVSKGLLKLRLEIGGNISFRKVSNNLRTILEFEIDSFSMDDKYIKNELSHLKQKHFDYMIEGCKVENFRIHHTCHGTSDCKIRFMFDKVDHRACTSYYLDYYKEMLLKKVDRPL